MGMEVAWAKEAPPHAPPAPFRFFAAKGEEQAGFPPADVGPGSLEAAEWDE